MKKAIVDSQSHSHVIYFIHFEAYTNIQLSCGNHDSFFRESVPK